VTPKWSSAIGVWHGEKVKGTPQKSLCLGNPRAYITGEAIGASNSLLTYCLCQPCHHQHCFLLLPHSPLSPKFSIEAPSVKGTQSGGSSSAATPSTSLSLCQEHATHGGNPTNFNKVTITDGFAQTCISMPICISSTFISYFLNVYLFVSLSKTKFLCEGERAGR
jgi:hypothetical protein